MSKQKHRLHQRATVPKEALLGQFTSSGFTVVKLKPHSKAPAGGSGWQQRATKDLHVIRSWQDCNYGVLAGTQLPNGNRLVIIDVDCKNGKNGRKSFQMLRQDFSLPPTAYSITPSGGEHHYFTVPPDTPLTGISQLLQALGYGGLDLLGHGLFAVEAPSVLPTGEYEWMRYPSEGFSELPGAFLAILRLRGRTRSSECHRRKEKPVPLDRRTPTCPAKSACGSDREHRFFKRVCRSFPVTGPERRNSKICRAVLCLFDRGLCAETATRIMTRWLGHFRETISIPLSATLVRGSRDRSRQVYVGLEQT